jgi:hypothetical protein
MARRKYRIVRRKRGTLVRAGAKRCGKKCCSPGKKIKCVKPRRKGPKTAWQKKFGAAARKCKRSWKNGRRSFNACIKKALK